MPDKAPLFPTVQGARDERLDVFRGLALVMIFINHIPGTMWEHWTSRNFGFSDAAEAFVLMSGISAGLAYGNYFRPTAMQAWTGLARVWRRVWTLYLVHLLVTVWALAIAAFFVLAFNLPELLHRNAVNWFFEQPLGFLVGVPLLSHQLGYANILPLYAVLLFLAPAALILARRSPRVLVALSVLIWLVAAQFRINLPNYPTPGGWFFNPLSWQLLFVLGLLTGVALKDGRRFVPVHFWLQMLASGYILLSLLAVRIEAVGVGLGHSLWLLQEHGAPRWITVFDKTYLHLPRLLHILALAYLLSTLAIARRACAHPTATPLALLGRQALPVFALGSILCFVGQGIKSHTGEDPFIDTTLIAIGLGLQFALAAARQYWPRDAIRTGKHA
jgi:hypothetical protein